MAQLNINFTSPDNPFRFTDPIRKYKENDPYIADVDNIPIKQLEENILWIKNSLENATVDVEVNNPSTSQGLTTVTRENFIELKPFVKVGERSNLVFVNPGRFTARINDAYNLTPLQVITRITTSAAGEFNTWDVATEDNPALSAVLNKLKSSIVTDSIGMNGMTERSFVNPYTYNPEFIFNWTTWTPNQGNDGFDRNDFNLQATENYPNFFSFLWGDNTFSQDYPTTRGVFEPSELELSSSEDHASPTGTVHRLTQYGRDLFYGDADFVKRWRGIARTAIVDVPEELSIPISNFESEDFRYFTPNGSINTSLSSIANSRIDLLFIYSKSIDQSETHISQYDLAAATGDFGNSPLNSVPKKLVKAELGIIQGAGLEISYEQGSRWFFANPDGSTSRPEIVAQAADQINSNLGFTSLGVHGSFPAPDDLMNMSPLLAEWLPKRHIALVGQTILPLAYIVVRKDSKVNNLQVINTGDIIDIRPFFRTTELAYNERAGLAAAIPSVSLINPVATESFVKYELNKIKELIPEPVTSTNNQSTNVPLLATQFNIINISCSTDKLITIGKQGATRTIDRYFGGRRFGLWPNLGIDNSVTGVYSTAQAIDEGQLSIALTAWKNNSTVNQIPDGVYSIPMPQEGGYVTYFDNVKLFLFTLENVPALLGSVSGLGTWDLLMDAVKPKAFNTPVQTPRNQEGYPKVIPPVPRIKSGAEGNYNQFTNGTNLAAARTKIGPEDQFPSHFFGTEWTIGRESNDSEYARWMNPTPSVAGRVIDAVNAGVIRPGWKVFNDFDGYALYNSDFQTVAIVSKPRNQAPTISDPAIGITIERLYKPQIDFYRNNSVDIRVALLVSNRILLKEIELTLHNMRVS